MLEVWLRGLATAVISGVRFIGGGKFEPFPTIPFAPGVLVLMNHQSLLDIPIVVRCVEGGGIRVSLHVNGTQKAYPSSRG